MSEAACRSGDAKLKTEAQRDCVFLCPSATSARYTNVERALVADTEPNGFCFLTWAGFLMVASCRHDWRRLRCCAKDSLKA